ncbi:MAG: DUF2231 domain-containing protein [Sphingomonas sp.]
MAETEFHPRSKASIFGHPVHAMLVPFPIVCFTGALITDIVYTQNADMMWTNFSAWLLAAGVVIGGFAALFGLIDFIASRRMRAHAIAWVHMIGNLIAWVLALFNCFVHSHDAWTSVVPTGITLSAVTVAVLVVTMWLGQSLVYRHGAGVIR